MRRFETLLVCCQLNPPSPNEFKYPHVRLNFVVFLGSVNAFTGQLRAATESTVLNKCFSSLFVKMRLISQTPKDRSSSMWRWDSKLGCHGMATWWGLESTAYWVKLYQLFLIPLLRTLWSVTTLFIQTPANVQFSVLRNILLMLEMLQAVFMMC